MRKQYSFETGQEQKYQWVVGRIYSAVSKFTQMLLAEIQSTCVTECEIYQNMKNNKMLNVTKCEPYYPVKCLKM